MRLDWRGYILQVTVIGMEMCPLYALLAVITLGHGDPRLPAYSFLLVYLTAVAVRLALKLLRARWFVTYPVGFLAWLVVMLLVVKLDLYPNLAWSDPAWLLAVPQAIDNMIYDFASPLLVFLASLLAWVLGWRAASVRAAFALALAEFQFALTLMLIVFYVAGQVNITVDGAVPLVTAFFVIALLGMSLAHAREDTGWFSRRRAQWPGLLLLTIGLVLVLGLAVGAILTPNVLQLAFNALAWMWDQFMRLLTWLVSLLPASAPAPPPPGLNETAAAPSEWVLDWGIPENLRTVLQIAWSTLFIGLVLVVLWRISSEVFAWMRRRMGKSGAEVETMPGAFRADLLALLKRILFKLFHIRPRRAPEKSEPKEIAGIRQLYRQLLQWAATGGWRRAESQTPYEFLPTLEKVLPACADDFRLITRHYVNARYGRTAPTAAEMTRLKRSWHQITHYRVEPAKGG